VYNIQVSNNHNYYVGAGHILVHNKTYVYISGYNIRTTFKNWEKHLAVHSGVPAWKDGNDELHFGEIPKSEASDYDWYFLQDGVDSQNIVDWSNPYTQTFDFFTNDLSGQGMASYSWPFSHPLDNKFSSVDLEDAGDGKFKQRKKVDYRGCLTNMWGGCEPVCAIASKLLKDGFFCSYPWNIGLGYMFRKKSIPKLVFVFANEFDNSFTNRYVYSSGGSQFHTPVIVPGSYTGTIRLYVADLGTNTEPIDQYCLKQLETSKPSVVVNAFKKYM